MSGPVLDERLRLPVAGREAMLAELRHLSRGHGWALTGTVALLVASAGLGLVFPLTVGWIVDTVTTRGGGDIPAAFWWQLGILGGAVVFAAIFEFAGIVALARVAETVIAELRERYVEHALALPQDLIETVGTGDIVARSSSDIRELSDGAPDILPRLASAVFTLALSIGGMAVIDWRFAVALVAILPIYVVILRWYLRTAPQIYAASRAAESSRSQQVLTTINALPTVVAYRLGASRLTLARRATWEIVRWAMEARIVQNRLFGRINVAEAFGVLVVLGLGFALTSAGITGVGQVTAAALLYFRIIAPLGELMFFMDDLQSAVASFARVVGVTRLQTPDLDHEEGAAPSSVPQPGDELLRMRDVRFGYRPGHPVLDDISLDVAAGEHVALVGTTGSGKTTLARLIAGTHAPLAGSLERDIPAEHIAYLSQEHHVFAGTLRDNLALARPEAGDDELHSALDSVGATRLLHTLPDGLDTIVGEEGHRVTASDAQHIALARLVLHDPVLAILDEATAEADSRDAATLDQATAAAVAGRAAVVIAHRLNQAEVCDRIVVMDTGRIVEEGSHDALVSRGGNYARLWAAWSGARRNPLAPLPPPRT